MTAEDRSQRERVIDCHPSLDWEVSTRRRCQSESGWEDYPRAAQTEAHIGVNHKWQGNFYDPDGTRTEFMEPDTADGLPSPMSHAPYLRLDHLAQKRRSHPGRIFQTHGISATYRSDKMVGNAPPIVIA